MDGRAHTLALCSWPLCRESGFAMRRAYLDRSLAMCLLKPSSLPQCVFAMRLRLPNVSSQFVFAYPMCLRNASVPPNASSQCVCATQCVFAMRLRLPMRLHPMRLQNANASSQCGCVFRSFTTLPQDTAMYTYIYIHILYLYIHTHYIRTPLEGRSNLHVY